jgi:hypothetical protein
MGSIPTRVENGIASDSQQAFSPAERTEKTYQFQRQVSGINCIRPETTLRREEPTIAYSPASKSFADKPSIADKIRAPQKTQREKLDTYTLLMRDINKFVSTEYESSDSTIIPLNVDPADIEIITIPEPDTFASAPAEEKKQSMSCLSNDGNHFAIWHSKNVRVLNVRGGHWENDVKVDLESVVSDKQVFFTPTPGKFVVVTDSEVGIYEVGGSKLQTFSLPKNEEEFVDDPIQPLLSYYFLSDNETVNNVGYFIDKNCVGLMLCDGYYFYLVDLRYPAAKEFPLLRGKIDGQKDKDGSEVEMRGAHCFTQVSSRTIFTFTDTNQDGTSSTIVREWKINSDPLVHFSGTPWNGITLVSSMVETGKRFLIADTTTVCPGQSSFWVHDANENAFFKFDFSGQKGYSLAARLQHESSGHPESIQSAANDNYLLVREGQDTIVLYSKFESKYETIFRKKCDSDISIYLSLRLDVLVVRKASEIILMPIDLPPGIRTFCMQKNIEGFESDASNTFFVTENSIISVDVFEGTFITKDGHNRFNSHKLEHIIHSSVNMEEAKKEKMLLKEFQLVEKYPPRVAFALFSKSKKIHQMESVLMLVIDPFTEEVFYSKFVKHPNMNSVTISERGRCFCVTCEDASYSYHIEGDEKQFLGGEGKMIKVKDKFIFWNSIDGVASPTTVLTLFDTGNPSRYMNEQCLINSTGDYKYFKVSDDENTLILYGQGGFCVVDFITYQHRVVENAHLALNANCLEISPCNKFFAIFSMHEGRVYMYDLSDLKQSEVCSSSATGKSLVFQFLKETNMLLVVDPRKEEISTHYVRDLLGGHAKNKFTIPIGSLKVPPSLVPIRIVKKKKSVAILCSVKLNKKVLFYIKRPSNFLNHLNLSFIRREIANFTATDEEEKKQHSVNKILSLIRVNDIHALYMHPIFLIIVYHLNYPGMLDKFSAFFGDNRDGLFSRQGLLKLFFKVNKKESMKSALSILKHIYLVENRYPSINQGEIVRMIESMKMNLLTDDLRKSLFEFLLFAPYKEKFTGELKNDQRGVIRIAAHGDNTDLLKSRLIRDTALNLMMDQPKSISDIEVFETLIKLDLSSGSTFSRAFFQTLEHVSNESLKNRYKVFVYHKWNRIFWYAIFYAFSYWAMNLLAYIHLGYFPELKWMAVLIYIMCSGFLAFELKCMMSDPTRYFRDTWNYIDWSISVFLIVTCAIVSKRHEDEMTLAMNWIRLLSVVLLSVRSLTWLRVFRPIRYLITMVFQVFVDVMPFTAILIFMIFIVGYVWKFLPLLDESSSEPVTFYTSIQTPINIIFGNAPTDYNGSQFTVIQLIVMILSSSILALVLMNFLIALISGTFSNVQSNHEFHDIKELLYIIRDFDAFLVGVRRLLSRIYRRTAPGYYLSLIPSVELEDQFIELQRSVENALMSQQDYLNKELARIEKVVEKEGKGVRAEVKREGGLIVNVVQNLESNMSPRDIKKIAAPAIQQGPSSDEKALEAMLQITKLSKKMDVIEVTMLSKLEKLTEEIKKLSELTKSTQPVQSPIPQHPPT